MTVRPGTSRGNSRLRCRGPDGGPIPRSRHDVEGAGARRMRPIHDQLRAKPVEHVVAQVGPGRRPARASRERALRIHISLKRENVASGGQRRESASSPPGPAMKAAASSSPRGSYQVMASPMAAPSASTSTTSSPTLATQSASTRGTVRQPAGHILDQPQDGLEHLGGAVGFTVGVAHDGRRGRLERERATAPHVERQDLGVRGADVDPEGDHQASATTSTTTRPSHVSRSKSGGSSGGRCVAPAVPQATPSAIAWRG